MSSAFIDESTKELEDDHFEITHLVNPVFFIRLHTTFSFAGILDLTYTYPSLNDALLSRC